jgi:hypothetical protein
VSRAETATANRVGPAPAAGRPPRSTARGDLPEALLDRYLVERDRQGRPERFFRDHRAAEPMFRDRGGSLVSSHAYPDAIADMLKIARHRGWNQVRVTGDPAFRREVWVQAQAMGLEVRGHRPRERDRQAAGQAPDPSKRANPELAERLARAAVVVTRLIPDPDARARLLARAWSRAGLDRDGQSADRGRERSR